MIDTIERLGEIQRYRINSIALVNRLNPFLPREQKIGDGRPGSGKAMLILSEQGVSQKNRTNSSATIDSITFDMTGSKATGR